MFFVLKVALKTDLHARWKQYFVVFFSALEAAIDEHVPSSTHTITATLIQCRQLFSWDRRTTGYLVYPSFNVFVVHGLTAGFSHSIGCPLYVLSVQHCLMHSITSTIWLSSSPQVRLLTLLAPIFFAVLQLRYYLPSGDRYLCSICQPWENTLVVGSSPLVCWESLTFKMSVSQMSLKKDYYRLIFFPLGSLV